MPRLNLGQFLSLLTKHSIFRMRIQSESPGSDKIHLLKIATESGTYSTYCINFLFGLGWSVGGFRVSTQDMSVVVVVIVQDAILPLHPVCTVLQEEEWMACLLDDLRVFRHPPRHVDDRSPGRGEMA